MPTLAGCQECEWSPETDKNQPFHSNMEAKAYAKKHVEETGHTTWIKDINQEKAEKI